MRTRAVLPLLAGAACAALVVAAAYHFLEPTDQDRRNELETLKKELQEDTYQARADLDNPAATLRFVDSARKKLRRINRLSRQLGEDSDPERLKRIAEALDELQDAARARLRGQP